MRSMSVRGGIVCFCESKAVCPYCERPVTMEEAAEVLHESENGFIRHECRGCGREMGITSDIRGDMRSFEWEEEK